MKINIFLSFAISVLLIFSSCSHKPDELDKIEESLSLDPNSGLTALRKLDLQTLSPSQKAHYAVIFSETYDQQKMHQTAKTDSLLDFAIQHYIKTENSEMLGRAYYSKARKAHKDKQFESAIQLYLNALDALKETHNYLLLAKTENVLANILYQQHELVDAQEMYINAAKNFKSAKSASNYAITVMNIGQTFADQGEVLKAFEYYDQALKLLKYPQQRGQLYLKIGSGYHLLNRKTEALSFLRKSLKFSYSKNTVAEAQKQLAQVFYAEQQYDSAQHYALKALESNPSIYIKKYCYQILIDIYSRQDNLKETSHYIHSYQLCTDSIKAHETEPRVRIIESIHRFQKESDNQKRQLVLLSLLAGIIILLLAALGSRLVHKKKSIEQDLLENEKLIRNTDFDSQGYFKENIKKIVENTRVTLINGRSRLSEKQQNEIEIKAYKQSLALDKPDVFELNINSIFNNFIIKLRTQHPDINSKEVLWCVFEILDIPGETKILLLETTQNGLYKIKQRLAKKMGLTTTKELDNYINTLISNTN